MKRANMTSFALTVGVVGMALGALAVVQRTSAAQSTNSGAPVNILPPLSDEGGWHLARAVSNQVDAVASRDLRPNTIGAIVRRVDGVDSDIAIVPFKSIHLVDGHTYTLSFMARSDGGHPIRVFAQTEGKNGHPVGLNFLANPGFAYQPYVTSFVASGVGDKPVSFTIAIGTMTGGVWLWDLSLKDETPNGPRSTSPAAA